MTRRHDALDHLHIDAVDLKRRRIFLYDTESTGSLGGSDQVVRNLLWLDQTSGSIELWINTYGGCLEEMWTIYDCMRTASNMVDTIALGAVESAGCLLLAGGTGTRYAMPSALMMWHGGIDSASDLTPSEFQDRAAAIKWDRERWIKEMARLTQPPKLRSMKQRTEYWAQWAAAREKWLDANDMLRHGIIDEIWGSNE